MKLITYSDGGARGNPGPSAAGMVIKNEKGETIETFGKYLGEQTNNYAEYMGLILSLEKVKELGATEVECYLDSELVTKQMKRIYKVKNAGLQKLFMEAYNLSQGFKKVEYKHILREKNKEADAEVNKVLDNQ